MGTVPKCSQLQSWLIHSYANRVDSIVPPCGGAGLAFLSVAAGGVRDSSPTLLTTGLAFPPGPGVDGWAGHLSFVYAATRQMRSGYSSLMLTTSGFIYILNCDKYMYQFWFYINHFQTKVRWY